MKRDKYNDNTEIKKRSINHTMTKYFVNVFRVYAQVLNCAYPQFYFTYIE